MIPAMDSITATGQPCWKQSGIWGDRSCPELVKQAHCWNCAIYSAAAAQLLDRESPPGYWEDWTARMALPRPVTQKDIQSVAIFRLGNEWLALPTLVCDEVSEVRPVHSLPHRRGARVKGLVNIRGEILICLALGEWLGLEAASEEPKGRQESHKPASARFLVTVHNGHRLVFGVEEIAGVHHFPLEALQPPPATVALAPHKFVRGLIAWRDRQVGVLDDDLLFASIKQDLA